MKRRFLLQKIDSYAKAINVEIACAGLPRRSYATGRQIAVFFHLDDVFFTQECLSSAPRVHCDDFVSFSRCLAEHVVGEGA